METVEPKPHSGFWRHTLSVASGYENGQFDWSIPNGDSSPNILSELIWDDLDIWKSDFQYEVVARETWVLQLGFSYGEILDGRNQDSDYFLDNRSGEFSRSYADTEGYSLSARAMLGYKIPLWNDRLTLTPALGYRFDQQKLEDRNGYQAVDLLDGFTGPFPGLDSSYQTEWHAGIVDLGLSIRLNDRLELLAGGSFAMGSYDGEAVWNLRDDFRQDPSFSHHADGYGASARLGLRYALTESWFIHGMATYQTQWTNNGTESIYFRDGVETNGFHGANWESLGFSLGLDFTF